MTTTFKITDINLFNATSGTGFSADVRINNEFSLQLGNDGQWSFPDETESRDLSEFCNGLRVEGAPEHPADWFAERLAASLGAADAVEAAAKDDRNWI